MATGPDVAEAPLSTPSPGVLTPCGRVGESMRSDARGNRDRIVAAAADAFAAEGLSVGLVEIARRAGVGNATVHRNFTKDELVEEVFGPWFRDRMAVAELAGQDPDPWHGF